MGSLGVRVGKGWQGMGRICHEEEFRFLGEAIRNLTGPPTRREEKCSRGTRSTLSSKDEL